MMSTGFISGFFIPNPCNEDWDKMISEEKGRFCSSCKKTIKDFTTSSNEEIIQSYSESNGKLCGRFHPSQLTSNNFSFHLAQNHYRHLRHFCFALLLAFGSILFSFKSASTRNFIYNMKEKFIYYNDTLQKDDSLFTINGKVTDKENKEGVSFANILIIENGTVITKTVADIDGNFKISLNRKDIKNKNQLTIKASSVGYPTTEVKHFLKDGENVQYITIELQAPVILGETIGIIIYGPPMTDPFYPNHNNIYREKWQNMPK